MVTNYLKTAMLLGLLTALVLVCGQLLGGNTGMILALGLAAAMNFGSYWFSDRIVLAMHHGREVGRNDEPGLYAAVERLSAQAGLPMPRVFVLPDEAPNAFATGRNPDHAAVAVTRGLLRAMDTEELDGVLAHELGHVQNRDILIASVAATIAGAVSTIAWMAQWAAMLGGFGGRDGERGSNPLALLAMALTAPLIAAIIQMAVSRSREYGADATGARIAGNPYGLARALRKLEALSGRIPMKASPATRHLFIVAPFSGRRIAGLFTTHPPIEERIRRLTGGTGLV